MVANKANRNKSAVTFGSELRRLREAAGMSQFTLGESIGVSIVFISDMERGVRVTESMPPGIQSIRRMLAAIGPDALWNEFPNMVLLAIEARGHVRIPVGNQSQAVKGMLAALATAIVDGHVSDEAANKIKKMALSSP